MLMKSFHSGSPQDVNNIAIILAESCNVPEKAAILIEQFNTIPKVMDLIGSRVKQSAEAGLSLMVALTRAESSESVLKILRDKKVAESLFKVINSSTSSAYCKVLSAQWYSNFRASLYLVLQIFIETSRCTKITSPM